MLIADVNVAYYDRFFKRPIDYVSHSEDNYHVDLINVDYHALAANNVVEGVT